MGAEDHMTGCYAGYLGVPAYIGALANKDIPGEVDMDELANTGQHPKDGCQPGPGLFLDIGDS